MTRGIHALGAYSSQGQARMTDKPISKAARARARVAELVRSGTPQAEAEAITAREVGLWPNKVRDARNRKDRLGGPGRKPNRAKGKAHELLRTSEVVAWLAALADLPGLDPDAAHVLEEASKGAGRGDIEACREPFSGKPLPGLTHKPFRH